MTYKFLYRLKQEIHFLHFLLIHEQIHRFCAYTVHRLHQNIAQLQHLQILVSLFPDHFHQHKYDTDLQILQNMSHRQKHHLFPRFQHPMFY